MRVTIDQAAWDRAVGTAAKAAQHPATVEQLGGMELEAGPEGLRCTCTDLVWRVDAVAPADVAEPGRVLVPARALAEFAHLVPAGPVSLESAGADLVVRYGGRSAQFRGWAAEPLPGFPDEGDPAPLPADPAVWAAVAARVLPARERSNQLQPVLHGVWLAVRDGELVAAATDGTRLAELRAPATAGPAGSGIAPAKALAEWAHVLEGLGEEAGRASVALTGALWTAEAPGVRFQSRLLAGAFPRYDRVVPARPLAVLRARTADLLEAFARAEVLLGRADQASFRVELDRAGRIRVGSDAGSVGDIDEEIPASAEAWEADAPPRPTSLYQPSLLLEGLRTLADAEEVLWAWAGPTSPLVLRPAGPGPAGERTLYLLMPLRPTVVAVEPAAAAAGV